MKHNPLALGVLVGLPGLLMTGFSAEKATAAMCGDNIAATFCTEHCSRYTVTAGGVFRLRYSGHKGGGGVKGSPGKNIYYTSSSKAKYLRKHYKQCKWEDKGTTAVVTCIVGKKTRKLKVRKKPKRGDTPFDLKFGSPACDGAGASRGHIGHKIVKLNPAGDKATECDPKADKCKP